MSPRRRPITIHTEAGVRLVTKSSEQRDLVKQIHFFNNRTDAKRSAWPTVLVRGNQLENDLEKTVVELLA